MYCLLAYYPVVKCSDDNVDNFIHQDNKISFIISMCCGVGVSYSICAKYNRDIDIFLTQILKGIFLTNFYN